MQQPIVEGLLVLRIHSTDLNWCGNGRFFYSGRLLNCRNNRQGCGPDPFTVGIDDRHFLKGSGNILHVVLDTQGQLLRHLRGQVLHIAHSGKALL